MTPRIPLDQRAKHSPSPLPKSFQKRQKTAARVAEAERRDVYGTSGGKTSEAYTRAKDKLRGLEKDRAKLITARRNGRGGENYQKKLDKLNNNKKTIKVLWLIWQVLLNTHKALLDSYSCELIQSHKQHSSNTRNPNIDLCLQF